ASYDSVNDELNFIYRKILYEYSADTQFIKNLKASERIWIQFRDAELNMMYPEDQVYGSVLPMCRAMYLEALTRSRIDTLKLWLEGIEEGDVCSGSVRMKH